jgi:uncharacterized protein (DUF169 family)
MTLIKSDLAVLEEFKFEQKPVGVKYLSDPLRETAELDGKLALCEMLKAAFDGNSFYAGVRNHACGPGLHVLGQKELDEAYINGKFGAELEVFQDERAAARLYHYVPRIAKGVANYVAFSPFDQLSFEPDVLIILATTGQAEILLRAMSYKTGAMWQSRYSSAIGCSWLFIYPYLDGQINFITAGLGFGMRRRKLFPEGKQFISIPFDQLPQILPTLREMPWVPRAYQPDGMEYAKQVRIRLGLEKS